MVPRLGLITEVVSPPPSCPTVVTRGTGGVAGCAWAPTFPGTPTGVAGGEANMPGVTPLPAKTGEAVAAAFPLSVERPLAPDGGVVAIAIPLLSAIICWR